MKSNNADNGKASDISRKLTSDYSKQGELRKKSYHLGVFRRRHVVLTSVGMQIFDVSDLEKPHQIIPVTADTAVSEINVQDVRGNHGALHPGQYVFRVKSNEQSFAYRPRIFGNSSEEHWFSAPSQEEAQSWKSAIENRAKSLLQARASLSNGNIATNIIEPVTGQTSSNESTPKAVTIEEDSSSSDKIKSVKVKELRARLKKTASVGGLLPPQSVVRSDRNNLMRFFQVRNVKYLHSN